MARDANILRLTNLMRRDWDRRARVNAEYYVATCQEHWDKEDFYKHGEETVAGDVLTDLENVCQGKDPKAMRVLEIGCGVGRVTRALAKLFGEVHAVDISGEMIQRAREALVDHPKAHVYQNNGYDLTVIPAGQFDFAYSFLVFQHVPSREIIEHYVREVHRLLRPGGLFKFQVQGFPGSGADRADSWHGVSFSPEQAEAMARRTGFELRYSHGEGEQYYWLWFFKGIA